MASRQHNLRGLFITGTDTGVGKTYVTNLIARQLHQSGIPVGAYKPVCSGARQLDSGQWIWDDVEELFQATSGLFSRELICPQKFHAPLAPPMAALRENTRVDETLLLDGLWNWKGVTECVLIEGVGGWKSPISARHTVADLASEIGFPILIVVEHRLGAISQTLLTIESIRTARLNLIGIVLNDVTCQNDVGIEENFREIIKFASLPVIGIVNFGGGIDWARPARFNTLKLWELVNSPDRR